MVREISFIEKEEKLLVPHARRDLTGSLHPSPLPDSS